MNKDTIKEVIESAGEVSWWTLPHFMQRVEGTDYKGLLHVGRQENIEKLLQEVFEQGRKEGVEMARFEVQNSQFAQLVKFYQSKRGSGHTLAAVKGVENVENAFLLVADEHQKMNTGLPRTKQVALSSNDLIIAPRRFAIVPDNYAIQVMFNNLLSSLTKLYEKT